MGIHDYQEFTRTTAIYPKEHALDYLSLGLASEAGEVAGKYAKWIRDGVLDEEGLQKEMGDVFWQLAGLSTVMGWSLADIASTNLQKLADRKSRLTITGSGDNR